MNRKFVYMFSEGNGGMRELLGGKGANLAEMMNLGMPVPNGFTITTEACTDYYENSESISEEVKEQIFANLERLEKESGKTFGNAENPLLVSVRSGARASMPGMMDTILNLGLNDEVVEGLARLTGNPRFAYDSYRRFIQMFSDVVMGVPKPEFEEIIKEVKTQKGVFYDNELDTDDMKLLVSRFKEHYIASIGTIFPSDPRVQLMEAVKAVFRSWNNERAIYYRRMNDIPSSWGTAVNVQSMVFGNMGEDSGTGVAFTRDPNTGERKLFGEYLMNAQGEDVVAGVRTPKPIAALAETLPEIYAQFIDICEKLESHYRDMQDMEFTIERGKLYMLQTRNGKRTAVAALRIAVSLEEEGMITKEEALLKVEPRQLDTLLHPQFDPIALKEDEPVAVGLPASPGAACGYVVFSAADAVEAGMAGKKVILVRQETSPEDIEGMAAAQGILTARGGMTSHAAVVARGMGRCCVAGCGDISINESEKYFTVRGIRIKEGDGISIDGSTGKVYLTILPTVETTISGDFALFMSWADEARRLRVRTNADTPRDAETARKFGAEGIGLCRTEHMFFDADRIPAIRQMIIAKNTEDRKAALAKLLPMQRSDFEALFRVMKGLPVTIRLLDPPLHEFLPHTDKDIFELAQEMHVSFDDIKSAVDSLHEANPMFGHRGCRLAITYPEIAEMQTRAIIEAAINVSRGTTPVVPEIMIPLVGDVNELKFVKKTVCRTADRIIAESGMELAYKVGTMIEVPRAALTADEIAKEAEFFSFGTNDLTQMTYGFSRDDAGKFLKYYYESKIFESDPFARLDTVGVGKLVKMAADMGKSVRPDIKLGICGEHGGDPSTIEFCHNIGLSYVSCSPFRVPVARLAAAQAAIREKR